MGEIVSLPRLLRLSFDNAPFVVIRGDGIRGRCAFLTTEAVPRIC